MTARHTTSCSRASRTAVLAGAGVTGLATLLAAAPIAQAQPTHQAPVSDREPAATAETTSNPLPAPITPDYGTQKYRVGVRVKDGADVPANTSTAGTKLHVVEKKLDGSLNEFDCVTESPASADTTTFCPGDGDLPTISSSQKRALGRLHVNATTQPGAGTNYYRAEAGSTVTITQKTVRPNLVIDPGTATISPCVNAPDLEELSLRVAKAVAAEDPVCLEGSAFATTDAIFDDPGLPPVANDDKASTLEGVAVEIAIKPNDVPKGKLTSVKITADPKNGTARLIAAEADDPQPSASASESASSSFDVPVPQTTTVTETQTETVTETQTETVTTTTTVLPPLQRRPAGSRSLSAVTAYKAIYTPKAGFVGVDTFDYRIATANGTSTARVTVTVTGAVSETNGSGASADTDDRNDLADTGAQSGELLGYAALLLAAGGGALAVGRQRRRGRHAR